MISICIPVKNRAPQVKRCVESLDKLTGIYEITIADFHSTDTNYDWFVGPEAKLGNSKHNLVVVEGDFSIGKGKNEAAKRSEGDILFFLDADLIVPQSVINKIDKLVPQGFAYAPIMHMQNEDGSEGEWAVHSFGQIAVTKSHWEIHPWQEWTSYGGDDNIFFEPFKDDWYIRDQPFGFVHQWHSNEARYENYKDEPGKHLREFDKARGL